MLAVIEGLGTRLVLFISFHTPDNGKLGGGGLGQRLVLSHSLAFRNEGT